jgi:hypothetical protein
VEIFFLSPKTKEKKEKERSPSLFCSSSPSSNPLVQPLSLLVIQVLSRIWALWGIVNLAPVACSTGFVSLLKAGPIHLQLNLITLLFCWCCSEVLRYSFYALKEVGVEVPKPLVWLRYSAFIVLYPLGGKKKRKREKEREGEEKEKEREKERKEKTSPLFFLSFLFPFPFENPFQHKKKQSPRR